MCIYLGNVSVEEIERRAGVVFPVELVSYLNDRRQQDAGHLAKDKWHCFDIPFVLVCENIDMAKEAYKHLKPLSSSFKEELQISVQNA
jgi:hypothetical protein